MHKLLFFAGNFLMIISSVLFLITLYPLITIYFFPPPIPLTVPKNTSIISIPKIHAFAPIILNIDPFNEKEYKIALQKGVAHSRLSYKPGEKGTIFLFAHSSANPWEITYINTPFLRLDELTTGDFITIKKEKKIYTYVVKEKKVVLPEEINYLDKNQEEKIILQTCWPIGTSFMRLLVFAYPK